MDLGPAGRCTAFGRVFDGVAAAALLYLSLRVLTPAAPPLNAGLGVRVSRLRGLVRRPATLLIHR